jgi:hypothetical protein
MKRVFKVVLRVTLLLTFSLICMLLWFLRPRCEQEIGESVTSLDGEYVASTVVENCHATTPAVTLITIRHINQRFSRSFYSNAITDQPVMILRGANYNLKLRWVAQGLRVECKACGSGNVIEKRDSVNGVDIHFAWD